MRELLITTGPGNEIFNSILLVLVQVVTIVIKITDKLHNLRVRLADMQSQKLITVFF